MAVPARRRVPLCSAFFSVPQTVTAGLEAGVEKLDIVPAKDMVANGFSFQVRVHVKTVGQDFSYVVEVPEAPLSSGVVIEGDFERVLKSSARDAKSSNPDSGALAVAESPNAIWRQPPSPTYIPWTPSLMGTVGTFNFRSSTVKEKHSKLLLTEDNEGYLASFVFSVTEAFEGTVYAYAAPVGPSPVVADLTFAAMRAQNILTDVRLRAAGEEFPAHRLVLAVASPVFRSMFSGGYKEAQAEIIDIVDVASAPVFLALLDYVYCGSLGELNGSLEVVDLLELADRFLLENLKKMCVELLLNVGVGEAVVVLRAAHESPQVPEEVLTRVTGLVLENLPALALTQEWADLGMAHPGVVKTLRASHSYISTLQKSLDQRSQPRLHIPKLKMERFSKRK
ncbi:kelch-like protein 13 [Frankliniella occidentalis]|uniref:Kelch-like protein 13 n=1 Tax=Frankliniella occidentalis TaxID=133901 RepID=A0A6J1THQ2_FRAOC|nr:kelch-like protein 13 [Frankliniella occidentalis]